VYSTCNNVIGYGDDMVKIGGDFTTCRCHHAGFSPRPLFVSRDANVNPKWRKKAEMQWHCKSYPMDIQEGGATKP